MDYGLRTWSILRTVLPCPPPTHRWVTNSVSSKPFFTFDLHFRWECSPFWYHGDSFVPGVYNYWHWRGRKERIKSFLSELRKSSVPPVRGHLFCHMFHLFCSGSRLRVDIRVVKPSAPHYLRTTSNPWWLYEQDTWRRRFLSTLDLHKIWRPPRVPTPCGPPSTLRGRQSKVSPTSGRNVSEWPDSRSHGMGGRR